MKRFWLGAAILLLLFLSGVLITLAFSRIHEPLQKTLAAAGEAALEGDQTKATFFANTARSRWETYRSFTAAVADHAPLEEIDAAFFALQTYIDLGWWGEFATLCAQLAQMAGAMAESQALVWWNLL